jgi:hypothetical protein
MRRALLLVAAFTTCSCYRIHYITGAQSTGVPQAEMWHHDFIDGLI